MATFQLGIALVLVVSIAAELHSFKHKELRDGCNTTDMIRFWNTTEPIWTYITAKVAGPNISCLVDVKINQTGSYAYIVRSYYNLEKVKKKYNVTLKGLVTVRNPYDPEGMILSYANNYTTYASERLLYQSRDNSCGVFRVQRGFAPFRLDLRVKNSSVAKELDRGCSTYFWAAYEHQRYRHSLSNVTLYDPSCQGILQSAAIGC